MCLPYQSFILFTKLNKSGKVTSVQEEFSDKLLLNDQGGCSGFFFQHIWFLLFIFPCWLIMFVILLPPPPPNDYSELQKWVINHGTVLHRYDYSAPSSAGSMLSPGSGIFAFFATQYSINAFSLLKLLKLFNPQRLIMLPSSYNLLITVSLTQVTPWLILMLSWPILMYSFQIKQLLIA